MLLAQSILWKLALVKILIWSPQWSEATLCLKPATRAQVLVLGAADLIAKPYDLGMLVAEIKLFMAAYP